MLKPHELPTFIGASHGVQGIYNFFKNEERMKTL